MKDKDVAFVSISVDDSKDRKKWLKMIKAEQLGGVQHFVFLITEDVYNAIRY